MRNKAGITFFKELKNVPTLYILHISKIDHEQGECIVRKEIKV